MAREHMSTQQVQEYKKLCREREQGRILTPEGLVFICEANQYDPEKIGKHFIEMAAKFKAENVV